MIDQDKLQKAFELVAYDPAGAVSDVLAGTAALAEFMQTQPQELERYADDIGKAAEALSAFADLLEAKCTQ
jgi:hypothetical protein